MGSKPLASTPQIVGHRLNGISFSDEGDVDIAIIYPSHVGDVGDGFVDSLYS